jgi:broad specificity phosphatase PhoE
MIDEGAARRSGSKPRSKRRCACPPLAEISKLTRLYFVRHGESEANLLRVFSNRDAPHNLTELGKTQVHALADKLRDIPFVASYSSPILRARQSAAILSECLGLRFETTEALREYDVGIFEGRSDDASWRQYAALHAAWIDGDVEACIEGGESYTQICARFEPLLDRIRAHAEGNVLLLGHGGTFCCVLSNLCSNRDAGFVFGRGLGHTEVVVAELTPDGLTCLTWGDSRM